MSNAMYQADALLHSSNTEFSASWHYSHLAEMKVLIMQS
jgi:hypothetical protein